MITLEPEGNNQLNNHPMNCQKCGKSVTPDDKFCPHCGAPQEQPATKNLTCSKCNHVNPPTASFCEKCGASLAESQASPQAAQPEPNKIVSKGSYSGKMTKSKSKFWKRLIWTIVILVIIIAIALFVWFQRDPEAGEKLKTYAGGLLVVSIFLFMVFRGNKKGKRRRRKRGYDDDNWNDYDDYDDDGDDGDDGGDD